MKTEILPQESSRAEAFRLWMASPVPMVTVVKTFDVTRLARASKRRGIKFTVMMCWCIGKAASGIPEFYLLPEKLSVHEGQNAAECQAGGPDSENHLFRYDRLAINVIVQNCKGGINLCDIPFSEDIGLFNADYLRLTDVAAKACENSSLDDCMIIGTSALPQTELDCIVNQYSGRYNNPFLAWGKYRRGLFRTTLPISLQFHHAQMDGSHAARFLNRLQEVMNM